jgi:transposase
MKQQRNRYDTFVIYLYNQGREDLLPAEFRNTIPESTKSTWRGLVFKNIVGFEYRYIYDNAIDKADLYAKYKKLQSVHSAITKIYIGLQHMFDLVKLPLYKVKEYKEQVIDIIQKFKCVFSIEQMVKLFRISKSTFHNWLFELKIKCLESPLQICNRRRPQQLTLKEVGIIKNYLTDRNFFHWPVASIAYYLSRKDILHVCLSTMYKYKKLLGLQRRIFKKVCNRVGIVSTRPNEYWHCDLTVFKTKDGVTNYIYFIIDNFSKKILGWKVANYKSMNCVKEIIKMAYFEALKTDPVFKTKLIVDGGSENHNHVVDEFIYSIKETIKKLTALKDITFSNSPVEALNKITKKYYLGTDLIENTNHLRNRIKWMVGDYNSLRPHVSLKGLTPDESYINLKTNFNCSALKKHAALARVNNNKANTCNACSNY